MQELNRDAKEKQVQGKEVAAPAAAEDTTPVEFAAALNVPREGEIITGRVVHVSPDHVLVDVGYKSEGIITKHDLTHRPIESCEQVVQVGDEIRVMVLSVDAHGEGGLRLSKRRADEIEAWQRIEEWYRNGDIIEAQVTEAVKGGLVVDLGLRAFLPASQVERGYVNDLSRYVGQIIRVKIIELDRNKNRVILSRKKVLEEERERARQAFWASVEEGQIRTGVVKSITDFGAFIDLGGVDGLLHVSEMSYGRVKHPSEVLKEGEEVKVKVLRLDREKGKVSLGLKQVLPDPWENVAEKYPEGSIVKGRVARLATFGAFVELEPGVDGLIHISQLADHRVAKPDEVVQPGQEVLVKVIQVRPAERRISLSLREVDQSPLQQAGQDAANPTE
ncbi:MAG: 30S ribosomal protein S1 [Bacillota bacterium]